MSFRLSDLREIYVPFATATSDSHDDLVAHIEDVL
jgi:hypothetical protein